MRISIIMHVLQVLDQDIQPSKQNQERKLFYLFQII